MKKKFTGVKFSTILSVVLCLAFAILFWLLVKHAAVTESAAIGSILSFLIA